MHAFSSFKHCNTNSVFLHSAGLAVEAAKKAHQRLLTDVLSGLSSVLTKHITACEAVCQIVNSRDNFSQPLQRRSTATSTPPGTSLPLDASSRSAARYITYANSWSSLVHLPSFQYHADLLEDSIQQALDSTVLAYAHPRVRGTLPRFVSMYLCSSQA